VASVIDDEDPNHEKRIRVPVNEDDVDEEINLISGRNGNTTTVAMFDTSNSVEDPPENDDNNEGLEKGSFLMYYFNFSLIYFSQ
jgi:hypothetical protein